MVSSTVLPSSRSERIVSQALRRAAGSKPVVGSSRKISSGSPTSASARSSRRSWPPGERARHRVLLALEAGERDHLVDVTGVRIHRSRSARAPRGRGCGGTGRCSGARSRPARAALAAAGPGSNPSTLTSPAARCAVALEDLDRRRLAGAVGTEQPEHLAAPDVEVDPTNRLEVGIGLAQAADLDRWLRHVQMMPARPTWSARDRSTSHCGRDTCLRASVLKLPAYRRLLAAYTLNELAWSVGSLALAVLVYRRTGSAIGAMGFFLCSQFVPGADRAGAHRAARPRAAPGWCCRPCTGSRRSRSAPWRCSPTVHGGARCSCWRCSTAIVALAARALARAATRRACSTQRGCWRRATR